MNLIYIIGTAALVLIASILLRALVHWYRTRTLGLSIDDLVIGDRTRCARCNRLLSPENHSGWMMFVAPSIVRPICKECDETERNIQLPKAET